MLKTAHKLLSVAAPACRKQSCLNALFNRAPRAYQINSVSIEDAPLRLIEECELIKLLNGETEWICVLHDKMNLVFWHGR